MIYAIIGLDVSGDEMCIFELHENEQKAKQLAESYRNNWRQRNNAKHADAIGVIELAPGFGSYTPDNEEEEDDDE